MKTAADFMTKKVVYSTPDEKLSKTISKMEKYGVKEIPVEKNGKLLGIATFFDVLDLMKYPESKVSNATISAPSVGPKTPIDEVIILMVESGLEAIPVVEDDKVIGIISEYDILKEYENSKIFNGMKVKDLMTRKLVYLSPNDKIAKARRIMRNERVDRIPVLDNGKVVGMIILIDILREMVKPQKKVRRGLRVGKEGGMLDLPVKNVMRKNIPILNENMELKRAISELINKRLKGTVVLNSKKQLEGLFYRFEALKFISKSLAKSGVWIRFPSCELHPDMVEILKEKIIQKLKKLKSLMPNLNEVNVRIKSVHGKARDHIYEINLRFLGPGLNKNVRVNGYNVLYTLEDGLDKIQKQLDKKKRKYP